MNKINYNNVPAPAVYLVDSDEVLGLQYNWYDEDGNLYPIGTIFYYPSYNIKHIVSGWQYDEETGEPFGIILQQVGSEQEPVYIPDSNTEYVPDFDPSNYDAS